METEMKIKRILDKLVLATNAEKRKTDVAFRKFMAKWFKKTQVYNYISLERLQ